MIFNCFKTVFFNVLKMSFKISKYFLKNSFFLSINCTKISYETLRHVFKTVLNENFQLNKNAIRYKHSLIVKTAHRKSSFKSKVRKVKPKRLNGKIFCFKIT